MIIYIDRSRVESRQECPRLRFYSYDFDGTGIAQAPHSLPLLNGITIHAAHARLLQGLGIDEVIRLARVEYALEMTTVGLVGVDDPMPLMKEQLAMLEGMVRLWDLWRRPAILLEYTVESIEEAWEWPLAPGLVQRLRMDAILRRKDDGLLHILDYKSLAYPSADWFNKFEHTLQTELYVQALKEKSGEPVGGMLYEGLVKGQYKKDTAKSSPYFEQRIQQSPYCYGWRMAGGEVGEDIWYADYTSKKGFVKTRVTDVMSTKTWVEAHLSFLVEPSDMFVVVPPICPPPWELERIKAQVIYQEQEYHRMLANYQELMADGLVDLADEMLDRFAPQNGQRCYKYGLDNRCPFVADLCWSQGADPLNDGGYVRRVPHHEGEQQESV